MLGLTLVLVSIFRNLEAFPYSLNVFNFVPVPFGTKPLPWFVFSISDMVSFLFSSLILHLRKGHTVVSKRHGKKVKPNRRFKENFLFLSCLNCLLSWDKNLILAGGHVRASAGALAVHTALILAGGHVRASAGALAVHTALIPCVCVCVCVCVCPVSNSSLITPRIGTKFVSVDR